MEGGEEVVYYQNSNVETGELDASFQAQLALVIPGLGMTGIQSLYTYAPEVAAFPKQTDLKTKAVHFLEKYEETETAFYEKFPYVSFGLARITNTKLLDNLKQNDFKYYII
eukprot:GHVP01048156.1.p1 GENE.GHVP01048156.1~~GHVP01048156.1.p1  ORF type:complete len:111 (+),score=11.82 GHVP01048156.1:639-971(+)